MGMRILEEGEEDWKDRERERGRGRMFERMSGIGWGGSWLLFGMDDGFWCWGEFKLFMIEIEIYRKIMVESILIRNEDVMGIRFVWFLLEIMHYKI